MRIMSSLISFSSLALAGSLLIAPVAAAQEKDKPLTAMQHYEYIQKTRHSVDDAIRSESSTPSSAAAAAVTLQGLLDYLARPDVRELATGNVYLYARRHDVLFDLAGAYARMGDKEKALDALEAAQMLVAAPAIGRMFAKQKEFATLQDEPRFRALMAKTEMIDRLWSNPNIATPYRERIPVEERIAGLSLFWAEARQNFVHFDNVPALEWDKRYLETLTKVIAAETTRDYYEVMMRFAPLLNDSHTNIYAPRELSDQFYSRPPLRTRKVEGRVLITAVRSPSLATRVNVGDEVIEVDGLPVEKHAADRVAPYVSASTPQDRAVRTYTYELLLGDAAKPVVVKLRDAQGRERVETIARAGYTDIQGSPAFAFRMTPEGVAYISLDHFESDGGVKAFEKALPEILKAKALVIDIRENGGGSTNQGLAVLSYLTDKPVPVSRSYVRAESALDRARGSAMIKWAEAPGSGQPYVRKRDSVFTGPVAVLIGPQTFSAAEDFMVSYDVMKRGLIVGEATGGSTGQPMPIKLPGGGMARICVKRDTYPDGRAFVGKGIQPGIEVKQTVADLRAGRDVVLERAIRELIAAK